MNISEVSKRVSVSAKTIRYYESVGLIPRAQRQPNGYRRYQLKDVQILRFVQRARGLGFSVEDVAQLLALWRDQGRASVGVKSLAEENITRIEHKIAELESMRSALNDLVARCHGDQRPECPIIDELAGMQVR